MSTIDFDRAIDRYVELSQHELEIKLQREALEALLMAPLKRAGSLTSAKSGHTLYFRDRAVLDADKLKENVSTQVWTQVTSRHPVAALLAVAIKRGLIKKGLVEKCSHRSKPWIAIQVKTAKKN